MKIGFDIGGVISKYPEEFKNLISSLLGCDGQRNSDNTIYFITDMHPKDKVMDTLIENGFTGQWITNTCYCVKEEFAKFIHCADYDKYGNMAKAVLIKELGINIFVDDFEGYLQWDSSLGPQPLLLKVQPDAFRPYWSPEWLCDGGEFGRRFYSGNTK
jgi:hypothetical protein